MEYSTTRKKVCINKMQICPWDKINVAGKVHFGVPYPGKVPMNRGAHGLKKRIQRTANRCS